MTGLLIAADVVYLTATTRPHDTTEPNTTLAFFKFPPAFVKFPPSVPWYAIFFVFLFGTYVVAGSLYVVVSRTTSFAWGEHVPGVHTKSALRRAWGNKRVRRVAREIYIVLVIVLGALLAGWLTKKVLDNKFAGDLITYVGVVAAVCAIGRLAYCGIVHVPQYSRSMREGRATTKGYAEADAKIPVTPSTEKPEGNYSSGWLRITSYNVVVFAVAGAVFTTLVTNVSLWNHLGSLQTALILFIGGFYPAAILIGLSYSVPADPSVQLPKWKNVTRVTLSTLTRVIRKMLSDSTPTIPRSPRR
jgi:hypothetical protein